MSKHTPGKWEWDEPENWLGLSARVMVREPYGMIAQVQISGWKPKSMAIANAKLIAAAPDLLESLSAPTWLVWSNEHRAWWAADEKGYSWGVEGAGRYTLEKAMEIAAARGVERGLGINPPEMIQPSPEWIAARAAAIAKATGN